MQYLSIVTFLILFQTSLLFAQPYWVIKQSIENNSQYYYGIGTSNNSEESADDKAYINFGKMIELKVQSSTENILEEDSSGIKNTSLNITKIESDVRLKGITITERFFDEKNEIYYSLIKYTISEYEKIYKRELKNEISLLKEKNRQKEEKIKEDTRHSNELAKIEEAELISKMEREKKEEQLELLEEKRKREHEQFMQTQYMLFYEKPVAPYLINIQNAEVGIESNELILKPTIAPFNFIQANYNLYTEYLGFSLGIYWKNKKIEEQDFLIKLRILKEKFGIYPITLAVGVVQYSYNISDLSNSDEIKWGVSPALMMNVSFPQVYSTASIYIERRKLSLGFQYYPFFASLNGKVSLILQSDVIFMKEYEDRFGNNFIVQPGLRFEVIENAVVLMISYEDNEYTTLTFDFKF